MSASPSSRKLTTTLLLIVLTAAMTVGVWFLRPWKPVALAPAPPARTGRLRVHALGRLEPSGTVLQLAPRSGNDGAIVAELLVREGDDVRQGDVLAVFDNHARRKAALDQAIARRDAAVARLAQVQAGAKPGDIEAQEALVQLTIAEMEVAKRELERGRELRARDALSEEALALRQWAWDKLVLENRRAINQLAALREVRITDVAAAQEEIDAAAAAVELESLNVEVSRLVAPADGRVLRIHTWPGERVSELGLLELGDVRHMEAVAEVFEADVPLLREGMPATIRLDSSDDELHGTVSRIGHVVARKVVLTNDPVSDTDARVVEVRVQLDPDSVSRVERLSNARVEVFIDLTGNPPDAPRLSETTP
jgi:HlyD family secretion protein